MSKKTIQKDQIEKFLEGAKFYVVKNYGKIDFETQNDGDEDGGGIRYSDRDSYLVPTIIGDYGAGEISEFLGKYHEPTFVECLIRYKSDRKMKNTAVYRAARIDRRLFQKSFRTRITNHQRIRRWRLRLH